jgi:hypothetical protein
MNENSTGLIHNIAQNYCLCLADFPSNLKPEHLDVPVDEQTIIFAGLSTLHTVIGNLYDYFALLVTAGKHWADPEYCYKAIEGPVKLLWALGAAGQLIQGSEGLELKSDRVDLDQAIKRCGSKDPVRAFEVLKTVGVKMIYHGADGLLCPGGYKKFTTVAVCYPADNESLLRALTYYALRLPHKKSTQKSIIFEVFLRADFRPLLPGYTFHMPHLPADEGEVTRTFKPDILAVWKKITDFMTSHYPQCRLYFRVPRIRGCGWVADYSVKEGDYGLYSIFIDEGGLYVRIVLIDGTINNMLEHVDELSPHFQENYLNAVKCKDCSYCGKHVFYTHGDHVHRLCKSPWFISPYLHLEDMPDIERLIDFRLANL